MITIIKSGDNMAGIDEIVYTKENIDQAINTKEHYEVLNGLFIGNHTYEEYSVVRQVRLSKLIDVL